MDNRDNRDYQNQDNRVYRETEVRETKKNNSLVPMLVGLLTLGVVGAAVMNMNKPANNNGIVNNTGGVINNMKSAISNVLPGNGTKFGSFEEFYKAQLTPATAYLAQAQKVASFDKAAGENTFNIKLNAAEGNSFSAPAMDANIDGKVLAKYIMSQKYLDAAINLKGLVDLKSTAGMSGMNVNLKNLDLGMRVLGEKIYVNFGNFAVESATIPQASLAQAMYGNFLSGTWVEIPLSGADAAGLSNSFDTTVSTRLIASAVSAAQNYPLLNGQKISDGEYVTYAVSLNKQNFPAMIQSLANDPATKKLVSFPGNDAEYASGVAQVINEVNETLKTVNLSGMLYLKDSNDYKMDINSLTFSGESKIAGSIVRKGNDITSSLVMSALSGTTMKDMMKIDTKTTGKNTDFVITNLNDNKVFLKGNVSYDINFDDNGSKSNWKINFSDESGKLNGSVSTNEVSKKDDSIQLGTVPAGVKTLDQLMESFGSMAGMGGTATPGVPTTATAPALAPTTVVTPAATVNVTSSATTVVTPGVTVTTK